MAQIIQNKFPIDTEARKAVGFGFPLNGNAVFNPTYQTRDQIKANLVNYLLTNYSERVFRPSFGSNLRALLFENIDYQSLEDLKSRIENSISSYFPLVKIKEIKFTPSEDTNTIFFTLTYEIINFGINDTINITIQ